MFYKTNLHFLQA